MLFKKKTFVYSLMAVAAMLVFAGNIQAGFHPATDRAWTEEEEKEKKAFPEWVQRGAECYGIVVFTFPDGRTVGHSIKSRILLVGEDRVRMRAMETINLSHHEGCSAVGIKFGDTWWEDSPDDLFKTRKEADDYLRKHGWME